jgi:transposase
MLLIWLLFGREETMEVALWAEIRRLAEIEKLKQRAIARRLRCCTKTVSRALAMEQPPTRAAPRSRGTILDPYHARIDALIAKYSDLSAVRVLEEISKGEDGYRGGVCLVRRYLHRIRPARGRIYQEVHYEPGEAMQVDWGACGHVRIGETSRRVSVLVATLCYSRYGYIEFSLAEKKADFYRALVNAVTFYGGSPRKIIFDNLKAAVLNGSGRHASLHPDFLALCGHFCMEPIACARRDPESKGVAEASVRYVKHNALQGRSEELTCWEDYPKLASYWLNEVANVRIHQTTKERPVDRLEKERGLLRPLPAFPYDTDEIVSAVVTSHAQVRFDSNRYSVPPELARKTVVVRGNASHVRVLYQGRQWGCHQRCYERGQVIRQVEHQLEALKLRRRAGAHRVEETFDALGPDARAFHLELRKRPVKTTVQLRHLLKLVRLYGRDEVLAAITQANGYQTYDAAYVESLLLQQRRRRELPSPMPLLPRRPEILDEVEFDEPDPGAYDRFCDNEESQKESSHE